MADVTNPEAIAFCNEYLRPIGEMMRAMDRKLEAATVKWNAVKANIPNDTSNIADGREAAGVTRLVGSDVYNVAATIMSGLEAVFATGNYRIYIEKVCVRPLEVS